MKFNSLQPVCFRIPMPGGTETYQKILETEESESDFCDPGIQAGIKSEEDFYWKENPNAFKAIKKASKFQKKIEHEN